MKATMRFLRHGGICRPMYCCFKSLDRSTAFRTESAQAVKDAPEVLRPTHRRDEFRPVIPQRVARQQWGTRPVVWTMRKGTVVYAEGASGVGS